MVGLSRDQGGRNLDLDDNYDDDDGDGNDDGDDDDNDDGDDGGDGGDDDDDDDDADRDQCVTIRNKCTDAPTHRYSVNVL